MLPTQLRAARPRSLSTSVLHNPASSTLIRLSAARGQIRSFWGWRSCRDNWTSSCDPNYQQFNRYRTLKTKAKLLQNLKRRAKWDWDAEQKPFFTPKHIRWASHWMGKPLPSQPNKEGANGREGEEATSAKVAEEDGYELSQKEKVWKEQMERLRKRIQQDPYEAVFGKRFEPFWSPLVPSWMREEMGLQGWPKSRYSGQQPEAKSGESKPSNASDATANEGDAKPKPQTASLKKSEPTAGRSQASASPARQADAKVVPEKSSTQPSTYSYASATSWDSWTQKTKRSEWDSLSGQTRSYEYDPISNRMVPVSAPKPPEPTKVEPARIPPATTEVAKPSSVAIEKAQPQAVSIPVKSWDVKKAVEQRKAIPIPPPQPFEKRPVGFSPPSPTTTVKNAAISAQPAKPAALSNMPKSDLDLLTAEEVRAKMGKTKPVSNIPPTSVPRDSLEKSFDNHIAQAEAILEAGESIRSGRVKESLERWHAAKARREAAEEAKANEQRAVANGKTSANSEWDQAETSFFLTNEMENLKRKKEKLLRSENGLFHIERQKRELRKLEERMDEVAEKLRKLDKQTKLQKRDERAAEASFKRSAYADAGKPATLSKPATSAAEPLSKASVQQLQTSLDRSIKAGAAASKLSAEGSGVLQPALDRMQSNDLHELDDSAAHESTEPLPLPEASNVPANWQDAAAVLQADRVKRTASKKSYPMTRWVDDMNARKAAYEESQAPKKAAEAERNAKLEKTNKLLESEVEAQKLAMRQHEERYAHKIRSLRGELETAYKQSSMHADEFRDRIAKLQRQLEQAQKSQVDDKYVAKIKALRGELDVAYKQSSVHADEYVDRIKKLEAELEKAQKAVGEVPRVAQLQAAPREEAKTATEAGVEALQGEGDFCTNVTKYAGNERWYKQPAVGLYQPHRSQQEIDKAAQKARDQAVVKAVRDNEAYYKQPADALYQPNRSQQDIDKAAQKARDQALVKAVREIYEKRYGSIDAEHRQSSSMPEQTAQEAEKKGVVEVESDVDLGEALAEHENADHYRSQKQDSLEAEIARQEKEAHEAQGLMQLEGSAKMRQVIAEQLAQEQKAREPLPGPKLVHDDAPKLIPTELSKPAEEPVKATEPASAPPHTVQWEVPPLYKVLAYDAGNDMLTTATTTSNVTGSETPISIPQALSQLYQPARFVPHFAALQQEGYQVIYGTKDLLVFKKVKSGVEPVISTLTEERQEMVDKIAAAKEEAASSRPNPVDGTSRPHVEPSTGNFASPTGFVNHDPVFPPETAASEVAAEPSKVLNKEKEPITAEDDIPGLPIKPDDSIEYKHYPRVKRQERVFSGLSQADRQHWRNHKREAHRSRIERKRRLRFMVMGGLGVGAVMYAVGALAESGRKEDRHGDLLKGLSPADKKRWQDILDGKKGRWDLNEGQWK